MSGGAESVLVQWHLQKQEKTFVSRIGDKIESISVSGNFYGLILGDNSVRVIRTDNNKCVVSHRNARFTMNDQRCSELSSSANLLVVPNGDCLQFVDFSEEHLMTHSLALRPRNAVSTADGGIPRTKAQVTAFGVSPDQSSLCTLDELFDVNTQIRSVTLRFWSRISADFSQFNLE